MRAGFFPNAAKFYETQLKTLGPQQRMVLLRRRELGDDRVYLYEVTFAGGSRWVQVGLAPDDRVSSFAVFSRP